MSTAARSIGNSRRGPQKVHMPFRGDNPEVGKKTGIAVRHVQRKSDGFEPFEEIMSQADKRTPPKVKARKKRIPSPIVEYDDGNGEMSMEMDDSNPASPMAYFTNSRVPTTPSSANRIGSSSRPVTRTSDVDFDRLPSPRPRSSRSSLANGMLAGPSNLSKSVVAEDFERDDEGDAGGGSDDYPALNGVQESLGHTSFMEMDQDDDNEGEIEETGREGAGRAGGGIREYDEVDEGPEVTPVKDKGKGRAIEYEGDRDDGIEEDIAWGLQDVGRGHHSDDEDETGPLTKKVKVGEEKQKQPRGRPRGKTKTLEEYHSPEGVRRGKRKRYEPLEWWRQEKVIYGRRESGTTLVPHIKEIRRVPKEPPMPLSKHGRKRHRATSRAKSKEEEALMVNLNPEEGWDDDTNQEGVVMDFITQKEVMRRIALTAKMVNPVPAANSDWGFQRVFGDGDFMAAGQLVIPPKGRKPGKGTKDNTYMFYVIEGAVHFKVHETSLILATGGMFMVPRGNTYFIENIADRDAKLFFTQARKPLSAENPEDLPPSANTPRRSSDPQLQRSGGSGVARSTSEGQLVTANGRAMSKGSMAQRAASTRV